MKHIFSHLKFKQSDMFKRITDYNKGEKISFAEMLYKYVYNMKQRPQCIQCSVEKVKTFYDFYRGYAPFCSRQCASKNKAVLNKRKNTLKVKYGVGSPVEVRWSK